MNNLKIFLDELLHIEGDGTLCLSDANFRDLYQKLIDMSIVQPSQNYHCVLGLYRVLFRIERLNSSRNGQFKLTVFVNGMKHFDGYLSANLKLNGPCFYYKEGIMIKSGSYADGQKDGKFINYDFNTETEVSTEMYENGVKTSDIYIIDGKKYWDRTENGQRMIGQVKFQDNRFDWSGRVLEFRNNRWSRLLNYGTKKSVIGIFSFSEEVMMFAEYNKSHALTYYGEIKFDERTLEYVYEGRGMKFTAEQNTSSLLYKGEFKNGVYCGKGCLFDPSLGLKAFEGEFEDGKPVNGVSFSDGMVAKYEVSTMDELRSFPPNYNLFEVLKSGLRNEAQIDFLQFVGHVERIVFGPASCNDLELCNLSNFQNLKEIRFEKNCMKSVKELVISRTRWLSAPL